MLTVVQTAIARDVSSPIDGEDSARFDQLHDDEKMMLFISMWNHCSKSQRVLVLSGLTALQDSEPESAENNPLTSFARSWKILMDFPDLMDRHGSFTASLWLFLSH